MGNVFTHLSPRAWKVTPEYTMVGPACLVCINGGTAVGHDLHCLGYYSCGLLHIMVGQQQTLCWLGRHSSRAVLPRDVQVVSGREAGGAPHFTRMLAAATKFMSLEHMQAQCLCGARPSQQAQPLSPSLSLYLADLSRSPTHQQA